jgi:integrase
MGRKGTPGLVDREGVWHIDKWIGRRRICESTGTDSLEEAQRYLARRIEEDRKARLYGVRPTRTFEQAAAKYVLENDHKRSLRDDISRLKGLVSAIGQVALDKVHSGALQPWVAERREQGVAAGTINHALKLVRRILKLAAEEWMDEYGLTWLAMAPRIRLLPDTNKRRPYPLNWEEQARLLKVLPGHLAAMALFAVNTGCRDREVCGLRWEWEVKVPELGTAVFIVPGQYVKNGEDRLIVLNKIAASVVEAQRGKHATHVFAYRGKPMSRMLTSAWRNARKAAGLPQVRVHDLKHTFGRRLRAAGVSFEDRQDLLGHRSARITTHYSAAELSMLIEAANRVCDSNRRHPELVVLRRASVA